MERRAHTRKAVNADVTVYLYFAGQRIGHAQACDLSAGGVFLLADDLELPIDSPLELVFTIDAPASTVIRLYRISAVVAHKFEEGVGVRFCSGRDACQRVKQRPGQPC